MVPPKVTALAPVKFVPVIMIVAPDAALVGVKEVTVGATASMTRFLFAPNEFGEPGAAKVKVALLVAAS